MRRTGARAGVQILCASLATAAGFLAFVPTSFSGVAELGLIAGAGMLIAFICTVTFLPAAIGLFRPRDQPLTPASPGFGRWIPGSRPITDGCWLSSLLSLVSLWPSRRA